MASAERKVVKATYRDMRCGVIRGAQRGALFVSAGSESQRLSRKLSGSSRYFFNNSYRSAR
jgi:hypothetical protein